MQINSVVRSNLLIFLLGVSMICVIYSIYLLSMSLIGLLIIVCFSYEEGDSVRLGINPYLWMRSSYLSLWPFTGFLLYFLWIVLSLTWSGGHVDTWFQNVVQNLSIPGIALVFTLLPRLTPKDISLLHFIFYVGLAIACLLVLWVYIPSYEEITLLIGRGRAIPVPMDHIRFSMLLSYGCLSALSFLWMGEKWGLTSKSAHLLTSLVAILCFIMIHILAVRSGLLLLYAGLFVFVLYILISQKAWKVGLVALIGMIVFPVIAYKAIPSVQNRIKYMRYDIERFVAADDSNYSDSGRLRSMNTGIKLWKEAIFLGHGAGEYKLALDSYYDKINYQGKRLAPHNQWIRTGMAYGVIGVLLLLASFVYLLSANRGYNQLLLLIISVLFLLSFMVESNMERYYALVFLMLSIGLASRLWDETRLS